METTKCKSGSILICTQSNQVIYYVFIILHDLWYSKLVNLLIMLFLVPRFYLGQCNI